MLSDSIFTTIGLGIDLGFNGATANDPGDMDPGPNGLQNKPILSSARTSSTSIVVRGKLDGIPSKALRLQFFSNPSGNEGKKFIGQKKVTPDESGDVTFTFTPTRKVGVGRTVTATATGAEGTSEFSAPAKVVAR